MGFTFEIFIADDLMFFYRKIPKNVLSIFNENKARQFTAW